MKRKVYKSSLMLTIVFILVLSLVGTVWAQEGRVGQTKGSALSLQSLSLSSFNVDDAPAAAQLAGLLVGTGPTAPIISNVTFTGDSMSSGAFSGGAGIVGFESGIVLGSGRVIDVVGPNILDGTTWNFGLPGDSDLDGLIPGYFTYDATVLEFDFECPAGTGGEDVISFRYTFTSEEYNEFVNSPYNDVFGFFLNGANIALLPDNVTPVSINNVNNGWSGGGGLPGTNPSNPAYYINNDLNNGGPFVDIEADGLTVVLGAEANINPEVTNHLRLAIADAGDPVLDSWVFVEEGSFVCAPLNQPPVADPNGPYVFPLTAGPFDGTGSSDPDGDSLIYGWDFGDGFGGTGATPMHSYTAGGIYDICLTVNDGFVDSAEVCTYAVVYDPSGGFVTGGGWIDSPTEQTKVAFNTIPDPLAGNYPSQPYQAQQTAEFGDHIQFAGTARDLSSVTVTMSSWAKHSDYPLMPAEGFTHPLTLNIYNVDKSGTTPALGTLIKSVTQDFVMQWRPEGDPTCPNTGYGAGFAWRASNGICYNGFAFNIVFDLSNEGITLPDEIIYGIASNTQTWGYAPIGVSGPYNSLNFALNNISGPSTGADVEPDAVFWNTMTAGWYSDNGAGGTGTFRRDTGWIGYVPAVQFSVTTPGAYLADPTLGGKATFGFVSKYKKGASIPDGNTEFQFKTGNLNFSSTSYEWLVVNQAGANAQFKGYGTIDGAGNYGFMLWAGDGAPDTFRIKIWDAVTEIVVYDNGTNQAIGGGSIVVHKK